MTAIKCIIFSLNINVIINHENTLGQWAQFNLYFCNLFPNPSNSQISSWFSLFRLTASSGTRTGGSSTDCTPGSPAATSDSSRWGLSEWTDTCDTCDTCDMWHVTHVTCYMCAGGGGQRGHQHQQSGRPGRRRVAALTQYPGHQAGQNIWADNSNFCSISSKNALFYPYHPCKIFTPTPGWTPVDSSGDKYDLSFREAFSKKWIITFYTFYIRSSLHISKTCVINVRYIFPYWLPPECKKCDFLKASHCFKKV